MANMLKKRYLLDNLIEDLDKKMVFIGGPRQVGKTSLALLIGEKEGNFDYLNWDNREDKKRITEGKFDPKASLLIFDEIHKYARWKNYIKGEYDKKKNRIKIIVTGSSRLNVYRRGGDSLMGRYHYYHLHPFSLSEALEITPAIKPFAELNFTEASETASRNFDNLMEYGGFPEPFFAKDKTTLKRFHADRLERLVREDIRDVENIREISLMSILVELLPSKVGSLFSLNSLKEDLGVAHKTISSWTDILENFYYHFRIYPFNSNLIKSLRKEPKLYLWDWSQVENEPSKLENMVASHLLKTANFLRDAYGEKAELFFIRDIEGKEVDFLITIDRKPWMAVEVKNNDEKLSKHLIYFKNKLKIPFAYQVISKKDVDWIQNEVRIMSVDKFLIGLI